MLSKHDEALIRVKLLCIGGGFLIALGAEKLVSRRIRRIAARLLQGSETSTSAVRRLDSAP